MSNPQTEELNNSNKVISNFENTIKKLTAIVQGSENLKPISKIKKTETEQLVEDLFKEENESFISEIKSELKALLKGYVTLNTSINEERKKLNDFEINKKKEFNATAQKLFNKIEGIDTITSQFYEAMDAAKNATTNNNIE